LYSDHAPAHSRSHMPSALSISSASPADLDLMNDWAAAEGWNPGLADGPAFRAVDPDGILIGRLNGEPIAAISAVAYSPAFGFIGFHICRSIFRRQGHGLALWNAGLRKLGDRVIGLDGVIDQLSNYRKSGFAFAYRNVRYGGFARPAIEADPHVVPVTSALAGAVIAYDRPLFPAPRPAFVQSWLQPDRRSALAYVVDGTVRGYGVVRACRNGHRIAPVFETARMYRGSAPTLPIARTFGITSFELG
jgi:hypothetical protein